jgi:hypothetical protein
MIRNKIYVICGLAMIVSMAGVLLFLLFFSEKRPESTFIFWGETVTLIAFGVSWLTKGGTLYPDKKIKA